MQLPTHEALADKRISRFKQLISEAIESQELNKYQELIEGYQSEHNVGMGEIAAALAFLLQRERPLIPEKQDKTEFKPKRMEKDRGAPRERGGGPRENKFGKDRGVRKSPTAEEGMVRYRIEVGRNDGVMPKHIVGAVANETGIDSAYIGHIKLYDDFSTIDLPDGLPKDIFQQLKKVRVLNKKMEISLFADTGNQASQRPARQDAKGEPKRHGKHDAKPAKGKKSKPSGSRKPAGKKPKKTLAR
jgi:ATP-dependent RNA helicase DeaD